MAPADAEREALREFGCVQQIKERAREQRLWTWPDELWQDLRFGVRMLFRQPGFSALALLCLTLGIGTNAAVFSWIEGILFHPYPLVMNEDRMFALAGTTRGATETESLSYPDFLDLQRGSTLAESFIVDRIVGTSLSVGDRSERASAGLVSANYFDALGIQPIMGRGFRPEEGEGRNAHPVTVISYQAWKDRYKSDPAIIGRTQYLNGVEHTIIGVAPENFVGTFVGYSFQFWVPISMQETFDPTGYKMEDRSGSLGGRLCLPEAGSDAATGAGRTQRHRSTARDAISGDESRARRSTVSSLENPVQQRRRNASHTRSRARGGRVCPSDRVRQRQ